MAVNGPAIVDSVVAMTRLSPVSFRKNAPTAWKPAAVSLEPDGYARYSCNERPVRPRLFAEQVQRR